MSDNATLRAKKSIRSALVLVGLMLGGTVLLTIAHKVLGWIDNETTTRGLMALIGFMLISTGNALPKQQDGPPSTSVDEIATRQSITRVGGWALMLGGLTWIILWLFTPRDFAEAGSVFAVGGATIVVVGYAVWRFRAFRKSSAR
jgi:hypothetical protein